MLRILTAFFLLQMLPLQAEIDRIIIKWNKVSCRGSCASGLEKNLRDITAVAEVYVDETAGAAILRWKPNVPFDFMPINRAMEMIGVSIDDIRVIARGTIVHDETSVWLISLGDNTRIELLSPVRHGRGDAAAQFNIESYKLTDDTRKLLLTKENEFTIVTAEGQLFQPERFPPIRMISETLNFPQPLKNTKIPR